MYGYSAKEISQGVWLGNGQRKCPTAGGNREAGCVCEWKSPGKWGVTEPEMTESQQIFARSPRKSTRHARQLRMPNSAVHKILRFRSYKHQWLRHLTDWDGEICCTSFYPQNIPLDFWKATIRFQWLKELQGTVHSSMSFLFYSNKLCPDLSFCPERAVTYLVYLNISGHFLIPILEEGRIDKLFQ